MASWPSTRQVKMWSPMNGAAQRCTCRRVRTKSFPFSIISMIQVKTMTTNLLGLKAAALSRATASTSRLMERPSVTRKPIKPTRNSDSLTSPPGDLWGKSWAATPWQPKSGVIRHDKTRSVKQPSKWSRRRMTIQWGPTISIRIVRQPKSRPTSRVNLTCT